MKNIFITLLMVFAFVVPSVSMADYDNCEDEVIAGKSYCTRWNDGGSFHTGECSCASTEDILIGLAAVGLAYWAYTKLTEDDENEEIALISFDANNPFQLNYNGVPDWAYVNINFSPFNVNNNSYHGSKYLKGTGSIEFSEFRKIIELNAGMKFK